MGPSWLESRRSIRTPKRPRVLGGKWTANVAV